MVVAVVGVGAGGVGFVVVVGKIKLPRATLPHINSDPIWSAKQWVEKLPL